MLPGALSKFLLKRRLYTLKFRFRAWCAGCFQKSFVSAIQEISIQFCRDGRERFEIRFNHTKVSVPLGLLGLQRKERPMEKGLAGRFVVREMQYSSIVRIHPYNPCLMVTLFRISLET